MTLLRWDKIRKCLAFQRCFGVGAGLRAFLNLYVRPQRKPIELVTIRIPQCRTPISLRPMTTDAWNFEETFLRDAYGFVPSPDFSPSLIIDAGANIGLTTIFFANRFPSAKIVAIECERSNFDLLARNTASYENIRCIRAGLWNQSGLTLRIQNPTAKKSSFRLEPHSSWPPSPGDDIPSITIDEVVSRTGMATIDLLKIDIEGAEKVVFSSHFEEWLKAIGLMMIEIHERSAPGSEEAVFSAIARYRFSHFHQGDLDFFVREREAGDKASG